MYSEQPCINMYQTNTNYTVYTYILIHVCFYILHEIHVPIENITDVKDKVKLC